MILNRFFYGVVIFDERMIQDFGKRELGWHLSFTRLFPLFVEFQGSPKTGS